MSNQIIDFEHNDIIFKQMNVLRDNEERLKNASLIELAIELNTNSTSYCDKNIRIWINNGKVIIYNDLPDDFFERLIGEKFETITPEIDAKIWLKLMSLLKTYEYKRKTNYCEGLRLISLVHATLNVSNRYRYENRLGDGSNYFQFVKNASHWSNDGKTVKVLQDLPMSKKNFWQWEIESIELAVILPKILSQFIITSNIHVEVNGEPFKVERMFNIDNYERNSFYNYDYKLSIISESDDEIVRIYYKILNRENEIRGYRIIQTNVFNNKSIKGAIILENTDSFANIKRLEISESVRNDIDGIIKKMTEDHLRDIAVTRYIKENYQTIRNDHADFISTVLEINKSKYFEILTSNGTKENKQQILAFSIEFVKKLRQILLKQREIPDIIQYSIPYYEYDDIEPNAFLDTLEIMGVNIIKIFGNIMLGNLFRDGEFVGMVRLKDIINKVFVFEDIKLLNSIAEYINQDFVYPINPQWNYLLSKKLYNIIDENELNSGIIKNGKNMMELPESAVDELSDFEIKCDNDIEDEPIEDENEPIEDNIEDESIEDNIENEESINEPNDAINIEPDTNITIEGTTQKQDRIDSTIKINSESESISETSNNSESESKLKQYMHEIDVNQPSKNYLDTLENVDNESELESESDIDEPNIESNIISYDDTEEKLLNHKGKTYTLKIVKYKRRSVTGKFPIFEINNKPIKKVTPSKFKSWKNTLSVILNEAVKRDILPSTNIYPILYNEKSDDTEIAFYISGEHLVALNTEYWFKGNKISHTGWLIGIASHELAHIMYGLHGEKHERLMEQLIDMVWTKKITINGESVPMFNVIRDNII